MTERPDSESESTHRPQEGTEPSTPTPTPSEGSEGAQAPPATPEAGPEGEPTDELARVRREAAQRRVQLREAEAERDQLRGVVAGLQRGQVESMVVDRLFDPADLWRADDVSLEGLLDDEGGVDRAKVDAAVSKAIEAKPHWARPAPDFGAGVRGQAANGPPSFGEALKRSIGQQPPR
jgi:hypothetical protein